MCDSRNYPYYPHRRSLEIPRGRGDLKAKLLEGKYEAKLEFPGGCGGVGVQNEKPSVGGVWIFSGTTQFVADWLEKKNLSKLKSVFEGTFILNC